MTLGRKPELVMPPQEQKSMRGRRFEQSALDCNLDGAIFGQRMITRLLVLIATLVLSFFTAILGAWEGGIISTYIGLKIGFFFPTICIAITLSVWLITATFSNFFRSLLMAALAFVGVFQVLLTLDKFGVIEFVSADLLAELIERKIEYRTQILALSVIGLVVSIVPFYTNRLAIATTNILLINPRLVYLGGIGAVFVASLIGSLFGFNALVIQLEPIIKDLKGLENLSPSQLQTPRLAAMLAGTTYGLMLWASAWWANQRRKVPWHHPDLLRNLALSLGCWRGTSFHQLDLSRVSLRGAQLANSDLRAHKLYRTCFQSALGLERAKVDSRYLDLEIPKVQYLLTHTCSPDPDFSRLCLRGAYLQGGDLRYINLTDTDLSGADLRDTDLRDAILAQCQVYGVDFTNTNLTGICIKDWGVNDQTCLSNVVCDYVYRELDQKGKPTDRYPSDRNFEPQEFESLYQEIGNVAELIFKEGVNWRAFSFSMQKLDLEDNELGLELKGFERRGDRWVVRVTHNQHVPKQEVERRLIDIYEDMKGLLAAKEEQINQLLGIASDQAEALKEMSQKPFGNSFFITGSTITNLTGSGNIEYTAAAHQVREMITNGTDRKQVAPIVKQFVQQVRQQQVATTGADQLELIQQLIVAEAEADAAFRAYLFQEGQPIMQAMAGTPLVNVIQGAIEQLNTPPE